MNGRDKGPCAIDGCDTGTWSRGWCAKHYTRWRKYGDPLTIVRNFRESECRAPNCEKDPRKGLYCPMHQARLKRLGSLDLPPKPEYEKNLTVYRAVRRRGHPLAQPSKGDVVYEHRVVLYEAIGPGWHNCHHCGMAVSWELSYPQDPDALVVDHLDEDRGNNAPDNLVASCAPCNFARSSQWIKQRRAGRAK